MSNDNILATLWRRRLTVLVVLALCLGAAGAVVRELPRVYETTTYIRVTARVVGSDWEATQLTRVALQSYAELLQSPVIASRTSDRLPFPLTREEVAQSVSISPVAESQLLSVTAEASTPRRAQVLADTYAETFLRRSRRLTERTGGSSSAAIAEAATLRTEPVRPRPLLYMLVAAVFAALLAAAAALIRDRTDPRLVMDRAATSLLGLPVVGRIPGRVSLDPRDLVPGLSRRPGFATAFDLLSTDLSLATGGRSPLSVAIVSAQRREGRTTCAAGLGAAAGRAGRSAVVVDSDLKHAGLSRRRGASATGGLAEVLVGSRDASDVIHPSLDGPAALLPAGSLKADALRISPERFADVEETLRGGYDLVIYDTAALTSSADPLVIASQADLVLVVVDGRRSQHGPTVQAIDQLERAGANIAGAVINRVNRARRLDGPELETGGARKAGDRRPVGRPVAAANGAGSRAAGASAVERDVTRA